MSLNFFHLTLLIIFPYKWRIKSLDRAQVVRCSNSRPQNAVHLTCPWGTGLLQQGGRLHRFLQAVVLVDRRLCVWPCATFPVSFSFKVICRGRLQNTHMSHDKPESTLDWELSATMLMSRLRNISIEMSHAYHLVSLSVRNHVFFFFPQCTVTILASSNASWFFFCLFMHVINDEILIYRTSNITHMSCLPSSPNLLFNFSKYHWLFSQHSVNNGRIIIPSIEVIIHTPIPPPPPRHWCQKSVCSHHFHHIQKSQWVDHMSLQVN